MVLIYGIDLSQKKFDVSFRKEGNILDHKIIKNNLNGIVSFLEGLPCGALLCAEYTGVYGELLLFLCNCLNVPIALAGGYEIRHSLGLQKGKTDKVDASRIREYGERFGDKLTSTVYPVEEMRELKELFRLRGQLVKERKMLLTHEKTKPSMPYNSILAHQIANNMVENLKQSIDALEEEIQLIIDGNIDLSTNYHLITGIIGIGQVTACELIVKTGNFKEINTARKASSYAGVCPFPNASGKMVKKSQVSNMADKELKTLLYMCAVVAKSRNPEYRLYYERKKLEGKPYFLIMNNIANKLLRTIYSIINSGITYQLGHVAHDPRHNENVA